MTEIVRYAIGRLGAEPELLDPVEEWTSGIAVDGLTFDTPEAAADCYRRSKPRWRFAAKAGDKLLRLTILVEEIGDADMAAAGGDGLHAGASTMTDQTQTTDNAQIFILRDSGDLHDAR